MSIADCYFQVGWLIVAGVQRNDNTKDWKLITWTLSRQAKLIIRMSFGASDEASDWLKIFSKQRRTFPHVFVFGHMFSVLKGNHRHREFFYLLQNWSLKN